MWWYKIKMNAHKNKTTGRKLTEIDISGGDMIRWPNDDFRLVEWTFSARGYCECRLPMRNPKMGTSKFANNKQSAASICNNNHSKSHLCWFITKHNCVYINYGHALIWPFYENVESMYGLGSHLAFHFVHWIGHQIGNANRTKSNRNSSILGRARVCVCVFDYSHKCMTFNGGKSIELDWSLCIQWAQYECWMTFERIF